MKSKEYFSKHAGEYEAHLKSSYVWYEWFYKNVVDLAGIRKGSAVLDLGCGPGSFLFRLCQSVGPKGKVVGVDQAPGMLDAAGEKAARMGLQNVELWKEDIASMALPKGIFDSVVSNLVLHHVKNKPKVCKTVYSCLKQGGSFVVGDWFKAGRLDVAEARKMGKKNALYTERFRKSVQDFENDIYKHRKHTRPKHPREFRVTPKEFARAMKTAGFAKIKIHRSPHEHFSIISASKPARG